MAPSPIRHLLAWSLPSVAVLLSYLWYKKRRIGARSDTGGSKPLEEEHIEETVHPLDNSVRSQAVDISLKTVDHSVKAQSTPVSTPAKKINRSLSGVETAPIDIVYPRELKTSKSSPVVISDEDLDLEIEKIKSMKTQYTSPNHVSSSIPRNADNSAIIAADDGFNNPPPEVTEEAPGSLKKQLSIETPIKKEPFQPCAVVPSGGEKDLAAPRTISPKKSKGKNKKLKEVAGKKMAQQEQKSAEDKMTVLKISIDKEDAKETDSKVEKKQQQGGAHERTSPHKIHRKNSGRDSANHSPSDVMLASPSLSSMSDNHSEGSSDSGKGGSDVATPPPSSTPQLSTNRALPIFYDFVIPQTLVGKLIGKQGCFVQSIKERSNASVCIRRHPTNNRLKWCSVEGTQAEIDKALKMIRDKFPLKKYSEVTLEQVHLAPTVHSVPLIPDCIYLKLIEGINNDTIVSCMVSPDHLFMQQPTHPSFPSLSMLTGCMNNCYLSVDSPMLPHPIPQNTVCVAFSVDSWYRAIVLSTDEEADTSYVKFLDFGGYAYVENHNLRQIRKDFIMLPFQAAECFLANVVPKSEDGSWPEAAYNLIAELTKGSLVYTQVAGFTPEDIPLVLCYVVTNNRQGYINLNRRLCDDGYAEWTGEVEEEEAKAAQATQLEEQAAAQAV